ncbi:hypothetical protein TNCV_279841 [Trichonephila clavipes]|nr:hypothetical protein TNCV_279841 [Trichonephila clavipes]
MRSIYDELSNLVLRSRKLVAALAGTPCGNCLIFNLTSDLCLRKNETRTGNPCITIKAAHAHENYLCLTLTSGESTIKEEMQIYFPPEHHWYQCSRSGSSLTHGFNRQIQTNFRSGHLT